MSRGTYSDSSGSLQLFDFADFHGNFDPLFSHLIKECCFFFLEFEMDLMKEMWILV